MDFAFDMIQSNLISKDEALFIALKCLAIFSTGFMLLSVYEQYSNKHPEKKLPNDAGLVLVPLAALFLLVGRDLGDAVITGVLIACVEFIRSQFGMKPLVRYALWAGALGVSMTVVPYDWLLETKGAVVFSLILFALWFSTIFVVVHMSGRRRYDAFLLPLFVAMHVSLIWGIPELPNHLGSDILLLGCIILSFAVWREMGGRIVMGAAITGFAAVWLGYIWLQLSLNGAIPALLILVAYPVMSRLIGTFDKGRHLIQTGSGRLIIIVGSAVIAACAIISVYVEAQTAWMMVSFVYMASILNLVMSRQKHENAEN